MSRVQHYTTMMCSICYIYEADTISDNNCAGVYSHRERQRDDFRWNWSCTSIIKKRITLLYTGAGAVGVSKLSSSAVQTISTLSYKCSEHEPCTDASSIVVISTLTITTPSVFLIRQVRRDRGLKRVDLTRGGSCSMFYTDGCEALMQINFLHRVGSFNKMLSSTRRLPIGHPVETSTLCFTNHQSKSI